MTLPALTGQYDEPPHAAKWAEAQKTPRKPIILPPGVALQDAGTLSPEQFDELAKKHAIAPAAAPAVRARPLTPDEVAALVRRSSGGK